MRELYINSELCDIDGDFNPTFQFRSFLFARMQGYEAARTWETSIPLTARNRAIIAQSQATDNTSSFPYTTHTVSFYSDGYPIVENGRAYMIGTGGGRARFVFVLGETLPVLKSLSEVKLRELTETSSDWVPWRPTMDFNDMLAGFGWCNFYSFTNQDRTLTGTNSDIPYATLHPTVTLNYIMNKIQAFFGITIVGFGTLLNGCGFPLKDFEGFTGLTPTTASVSVNLDEVQYFITGAGDTDVTSVFGTDYSPTLRFINFTDYYGYTINPRSFNTLPVLVRVVAEINVVMIDDGLSSELKLYNNGVWTGGIGSYVELGSYRQYTFEQVVQMGINDKFVLAFDGHNIDSFEPTDPSFINFQYIDYVGQSIYLDKFYIIPNLPDMTCADFINQCCMLTGLFPYVDPATPTVLNFYSAKVLSDNAPSAQNWSKCLIKSTDTMGEAEDMTHQLDGFAQNNRMLYADDPTNLLDTSGNLTVANTNIELEAELFKLTFAAGKRASSTNTIIDYPLYDVSVVDGALVRNPIKQDKTALGFIVNSGGVNYLTFPDSLKFSQLQSSTAYLHYGAIINRPHVLRERFTLSARLTSLIDVRIPIYLEQYGKYYAIMEAQVDGDYNADVTLLEI